MILALALPFSDISGEELAIPSQGIPGYDSNTRQHPHIVDLLALCPTIVTTGAPPRIRTGTLQVLNLVRLPIAPEGQKRKASEEALIWYE